MSEYLEGWIQKATLSFRKAPWAYRFYAVGLAVVLGALAVTAIAVCFGWGASVIVITKYGFLGGGLLCCAGFLIEAGRLLLRYWNNIAFKGGLTILGVVAYWIAHIQADHIVNALTGFDPSRFSEAVALLTAIYLLPAWVIVSIAICAVPALVSLLLTFNPLPKKNAVAWLASYKNLCRPAGAIVCMMLLASFSDYLQGKDSPIEKISKSALVASEYYPRSLCGNIEGDSLVADPGGDIVSVYLEKTGVFRRMPCRRVP